MHQILIAGIDPGTTTAYAFLDLEGHLVRMRSSKKANLSFILRETIKNGDVIAVGTDRRKSPMLVQKFAAKFGIKIIKPENDLTVREKNALIRNFKVKNEHEADALAAALYAYNKTSLLLRRIDGLLKKEGKERFSNQIKRMVLKKGRNIKATLNELEKQDSKS